MILFKVINISRGDVLSNIDDVSKLSSLKKIEIKNNDFNIEIYTDDKDISKSPRLAKKLSNFILDFCQVVQISSDEQIKNFLHTTRSIQGQLLQTIDSFISREISIKSNNYHELKNNVIKEFKEDPEKKAEILIKLKKNILELNYHITSYEVIHKGKSCNLTKTNQNIKKVLINIWQNFIDKNIGNILDCSFHFTDEFAENNRFEIDYKTISVAFYNFFDNAVKYSKPGSKINFYLSKESKNLILTAEMMSKRVEKDEIDKIFELGYRGRHVGVSEGSGVGLYVMKKALELNDVDIKLFPDYSVSEGKGNDQYILNKFIFTQITS